MRHGVTCLLLLALQPGAGVAENDVKKPPKLSTEIIAARKSGLDWLQKHQATDGSWGKTYSIAVTSFTCLAMLSSSEEPFKGDAGTTLEKGLKFLLANQMKGIFKTQQHSWIHGQGFATLALSEAYGRSLLCKSKPDLDMKKIKEVIIQAVKNIEKNQSTSGGWWYTPGSKRQHEGSTTVCAVQALISARNFRIPTDRGVLEKGFAYLKKCQNKDGGFDYRLGDSASMKEGTAAAVATLGLMQKFDYTVMINGYKFLDKATPKVISASRFPYYGHFYGTMGMHLLWQEYHVDKTFRETTLKYIAGVQKDLISWQIKNGTWPLKGWMSSHTADKVAYGTAFATMTLFIPDARLSIYNRDAPKLTDKKETRD